MADNSLNILLLSKGNFEGKHLCTNLFGREGSGQIKVNGERVNITSVAMVLTGKDHSDVVNETKQTIKNRKFHAVAVVLALPIRSSPETHRYLSIIRNVLGDKVLRTNTILLFTNGAYMARNHNEFQQFLAKEVQFCQEGKHYEGSLGQLIEDVHFPGTKEWNGFSFSRCLLLDVDNGDFFERKRYRETIVSIAKRFQPCTMSKPVISVSCTAVALLILVLLVASVASYLIRKKMNVSSTNLSHRKGQEKQCLSVAEKEKYENRIIELEKQLKSKNKNTDSSLNECRFKLKNVKKLEEEKCNNFFEYEKRKWARGVREQQEMDWKTERDQDNYKAKNKLV